MERIILQDKSFRTYIPYQEIDKAIEQVAAALNRDLRNEDKRGPHIVSIVVDTPTKLSKKQRKILEEF